MIRFVRSLPPGIPVFSNGADAIYINTGRVTSSIPVKIHLYTRRINRDYESEIDRMVTDMRERDGLLIYMEKTTWRWYLPSEDELVEQLPLRLVAKLEDGGVYEVFSPPQRMP